MVICDLGIMEKFKNWSSVTPTPGHFVLFLFSFSAMSRMSYSQDQMNHQETGQALKVRVLAIIGIIHPFP